MSEEGKKKQTALRSPAGRALSAFAWSFQYLIYCCILGLVSCSVFLRINYELKMVVMLVAVVIYNVVILQTRSSLLDEFSNAPYPTDTLDRYLQSPSPGGAAACWGDGRSRTRTSGSEMLKWINSSERQGGTRAVFLLYFRWFPPQAQTVNQCSGCILSLFCESLGRDANEISQGCLRILNCMFWTRVTSLSYYIYSNLT